MSVGPNRSAEFSEAGTLALPEAAPGKVSRWLIHFQGTGWTGSVTPKARSAADSSLTAIAVAFYDVVAGAMATAAPTADGIILVESTGLHVDIVVAASAGSVKVSAVPVVG